MKVSEERRDNLVWELNEFLFNEQHNISPNLKDKLKFLRDNLKLLEVKKEKK